MIHEKAFITRMGQFGSPNAMATVAYIVGWFLSGDANRFIIYRFYHLQKPGGRRAPSASFCANALRFSLSPAETACVLMIVHV